MDRPTYMMKRKVLGLCLMLAALVLLAGFAVAETADPIVTSIEVTPGKLTGPGKVNVTITVSNSGDTDMQEPVLLYDPAAQIVSDFGTDGAALLKAGESKTWTGIYDVNQRTLDNGQIVYYVKYRLYNESGKAVDQSQSIRAKIELQTAETDIDVKRTISPTIAREGQVVVVRYEIMNTGTVSLLDVTIQEHKDVYNKKQTIPELKPGQTAEIKYPVTMGKKDLTSSATITYKSETQPKQQTYKVEKQTIRFGVPELEAELTSSARGVMINGTLTLTLKLKNTGSVDYSDIRVTDPMLGDVFTNQELKAGKTLELTKEVTVPVSTDYQFTIHATDATGSETSITTDVLSITAVDPADALKLNVTVIPDKTEVFGQPGVVRFTIEVANDSKVDAKNVTISHGETKLYTFSSIAAGESRSISRDTALSMSGKYRFTVTAQDMLDSTMTFESNEMQIVVSAPTAPPATPTPAPVPTAEPTFAPATIPPITDASIGRVPKLIQSILLPVMIAAGIVLVGCFVLLIVAAKRRADQKKASEAAIDQLERAKRRDYVTPADEEASAEEETVETVSVDSTALDDADELEYELPHMKYARSAVQSSLTEKEDSYSAMNAGFYDDDPADSYDYGHAADEQGEDYIADEAVADDYSSYDDYGADESAADQSHAYDDEPSGDEQIGDAQAGWNPFQRPADEASAARTSETTRTRRSRSRGYGA